MNTSRFPKLTLCDTEGASLALAGFPTYKIVRNKMFVDLSHYSLGLLQMEFRHLLSD